MSRHKKLINRTTIPQHAIETIARSILPDIQSYFNSQEGQAEFAEWQKQQKEKANT